MSRVFLPLGIVISVLAQVPSSTWEQMSAMGLMGVVLIWIVTKTLPANQVQITDLTKVFAETVETINNENAILMTKTLANLDAWHERTLVSTRELTVAITENATALSQLRQHCAERLAEAKV